LEELLPTAAELELDCLLVLEDILSSEWSDDVMWNCGESGDDWW
jgi:hypothetical protein